MRGLFLGDVNRWDGLEYFLCVNKGGIPVGNAIQKTRFFGETSKTCLFFFVGEFIAPEGLWEDDFRNLAFGIFFQTLEGEKNIN